MAPLDFIHFNHFSSSDPFLLIKNFDRILDFKHFNHFSSSDPFLLIKNFDRIFNIRDVWFYQYFLLFNNFYWNSNTLFELRDMKDIMDGCKLRG
jgi:hypothetical protein